MSAPIQADLDPKDYQRREVAKFREFLNITDLPADATQAQMIAKINQIARALRGLTTDGR